MILVQPHLYAGYLSELDGLHAGLPINPEVRAFTWNLAHLVYVEICDE